MFSTDVDPTLAVVALASAAICASLLALPPAPTVVRLECPAPSAPTGVLAPQAPPRAAAPRGRTWQALLRGEPVIVELDATAEKFDDRKYTGDWRTDPLGTLRGGDRYTVTYDAKSRRFTTRGYNQGYGRVVTVAYANGDVDRHEISLWGLVLQFDPRTGEVSDRQWGVVGHLRDALEEPLEPSP